jgi:hypothetical protein
VTAGDEIRRVLLDVKPQLVVELPFQAATVQKA